MRYIIIGTGAIGGTIGGSLANRGVETVWVARGEHGRVLAEQGMTLRTAGGTLRPTAEVWGSAANAELRPDDVLVIATKTNAVADAAAEWADAPVVGGGTAGERLPLLLCTNGLAAEEIALRWFARVIGVCVWCPAVYLNPGEIVARFTPELANLHLSRVPASLTTDADRELLGAIKSDFEKSALLVQLRDDVMPWKRRKLLTNLANIVDALLGPEGRKDPVADRVVDALDAEARRVLAAAGLPVTSDEEEAAQRDRTPKITNDIEGFDPAHTGSSTWQSLTKGGALETDFLNGEIVRIAHSSGQAAPLNAAAARLAREAGRTGRRPGGLSPQQLAEELGLDA